MVLSGRVLVTIRRTGKLYSTPPDDASVGVSAQEGDRHRIRGHTGRQTKVPISNIHIFVKKGSILVI